jgi:hypothetical protein
MCQIPEYKIRYVDKAQLDRTRDYFHNWELRSPFWIMKIGAIESVSVDEYTRMGWFVEQAKYCRECVNGLSCQMTERGLFDKLNISDQKSCTRGMILVPGVNTSGSLYFETCICGGIYAYYDFWNYWRKTPNNIKEKMVEKMQSDPEFWGLDAIRDFILSRKEEKEKRGKY